MSEQIVLEWDLERTINRIPQDKVKFVLRELLKSLVRKGIFTPEEIETLVNES